LLLLALLMILIFFFNLYTIHIFQYIFFFINNLSFYSSFMIIKIEQIVQFFTYFVHKSFTRYIFANIFPSLCFAFSFSIYSIFCRAEFFIFMRSKLSIFFSFIDCACNVSDMNGLKMGLVYRLKIPPCCYSTSG
jgi:hypothetical protein